MENLEESQVEKEQFSEIDLICCTASRQFVDREAIFGGVGNAFLSVAIAKLVHVPNVVLITEAGYVGFAGICAMSTPADNHGGVGAVLHQGLFETFRDQQAGLINSSCLGLAQIDRFGNANVSYVAPDTKMNGSGGGGDISCSAGCVVYLARFSPRIFKDPVDYVTNPGFLDGSEGAREKANLVGGGPACMVTDRGVFRFDKNTREMYLAEIFSWQDSEDIDEIRQAVPWNLKISANLKTIEPPTPAELDALALMDPAFHYRIDSFLERPAGKIFMAGRNDLGAYDEIGGLYTAGMKKAMERLIHPGFRP